MFGFAYLFNNLLSIVISFLLVLPLKTNVLSAEDFGILSVLQNFSVVLGIVFAFYIPKVFTRNYEKAKESKYGVRNLISTCIFLILIIDISLIGPAIFIGTFYLEFMSINIGSYFVLISIIIPVTQSLTSLNNVYKAYLTQSEQHMSVNWINFLILLVNSLLTILVLLIAKEPIVLCFAALLASQLLIIIIWLYKLFKTNLFGFHFSWHLVKDMYGFALAGLPFALTAWLFNFSDQILIAHFLGLTDTGYYAIAFKIASIVQITYMAFWNVVSPKALKWLHNEVDVQAADLYSSFLNFYYLVMIIVGITVIFFADIMIQIITPESYKVNPLLSQVLCISFIITGIRKNIFLAIWYHKKILQLLILYSLLPVALNIYLNYQYLSEYGIYVAAVSTLISSVFILLTSKLIIWYYKIAVIETCFGRLIIPIIASSIFLNYALSGDRLLNIVGFVGSLLLTVATYAYVCKSRPIN